MLITLLSPELGNEGAVFTRVSLVLYVLIPLFSKSQIILDYIANVTQGFFLLTAVNTKPCRKLVLHV